MSLWERLNLFLTAKLSEEDKITGLTAGADDYLVKPFSAADISYLERSIVLCDGQRCSRYEHKYDGF